MKPVQYFNDEYLDQCRGATPEQILEYLESFRLLQAQAAKSKLISIKIPHPLLDSFRRKGEFAGAGHESSLEQLMTDWLLTGASDE